MMKNGTLSNENENFLSEKGLLSTNHRLTALNEIAKITSQSLDLNNILEKTLTNTLDVMGIEMGVIFLKDDNTGILDTAACSGISEEYASALQKIKKGEGIAGRVFQTGKPEYTDNPANDVRLTRNIAGKDSIGSLLCVPIKSKERILGVMGIAAGGVKHFYKQDIEFMTNICSHLGLAVENALLFEETVKKEEEAYALYDVTREVSKSFDIENIFTTLIDRTVSTLNVPMCVIGIINPDKEISYTYSHNMPDEILEKIKFNLEENYAGGIVARTGEPVLIPDLQNNELSKYPEIAKKYNIRTLLSTPIKTKDSSIGILNVYTHDVRAFNENEIKLLTNFGYQAGIAVENARLYEDIKIAKDKYEKLVQKSPVGIYIFQDGKVVFANDVLYKMSGYPKSDMRISLDKVIAPESLHLVQQEIEKKMTGDPTAIEQYGCKIIRADGEIRDIEICSTAIDYSGKKAIQGTIIDITEKKKSEIELKKRNQELKVLYSIASIGNQCTDFEIFLEKILNKVLELTKITIGGIYLHDENTGVYVLKMHVGISGDFSVKHGIINREFTSFKPVFEKGQIICVNDINDLPDSPEKENIENEKIVSYAVVPLLSKGKIMGILTLGSHRPHTFIPEEISIYELIGKQIGISLDNFMLFEELKKSYEEIHGTYEELKELNMMKSEFVANVSHEFRTPLTSIKGYAELMSDQVLGPLTPKQQEGLEVILRNTDRLTRMIQDILDNYRDEKGLFTKKISMEKIVRDVLIDMHTMIQSKKLNLNLHVSPHVRLIEVHPDSLIQVITNLISNAIKFTKTGGIIEINLSMDSNQGIHFEVKDNGIGIPSEDLEKIFDRFYQTKSGLSRKYGGKGLGLYLCKKIVEKEFNGVIWAESEPGRGSTFNIIIPVDGMQVTLPGKGK